MKGIRYFSMKNHDYMIATVDYDNCTISSKYGHSELSDESVLHEDNIQEFIDAGDIKDVTNSHELVLLLK